MMRVLAFFVLLGVVESRRKTSKLPSAGAALAVSSVGDAPAEVPVAEDTAAESTEDVVAPGACGFVTEPVENSFGDGTRSFVWSEPWREDLFTNGLLLDDAAFQQYTEWLKETIPRDFGGLDPLDQRACLMHQRDIYKNAGMSTRPWDAILNGSVGTLSAANCIESALWAKQNEHHPQMVSPTEFGAFILINRARTTVKVYLQTGPTLSVPGMSWSYQAIYQDLRDGFQLRTFLHLHPFTADNVKWQDCAGTCVPSGPDRNSLANSSLMSLAQSAWITNGHDSLRFPLSKLGLFNGNAAAALGQVEHLETYRGEQGLEQA